ncbi:MAG: phosphodiester glycosidase family protein [Chitinophagaceae bacterium]|jgi:exopolysaccharide biosynthesis protein|nr:phosphodiester glycosidase family protein [Chitinophagaceae bacterium]
MNHKTFLILAVFIFLFANTNSQSMQWKDVSEYYGPLPATVKLFKTTTPIDDKPNVAFYLTADIKDKQLSFTADTAKNRRLTPNQFYGKNNQPLVVVNTTFFSFATNQNLNAVIQNGRLISYNVHSFPGKGKDTLTYRHTLGSAIGITKNRMADVAWLFTDSSKKSAYALQQPVMPPRDSVAYVEMKKRTIKQFNTAGQLKKWKVETAVGGGPVLVQNNQIAISNNEELKFAGKAIDDKHPRTAMGYTNDHKLVILVVEGRSPGVAEGASLKQMAAILKEIGCVEALNLDGGGSSAMIVNGKNTINPSDKTGQRPVPAVFMISKQ